MSGRDGLIHDFPFGAVPAGCSVVARRPSLDRMGVGRVSVEGGTTITTSTQSSVAWARWCRVCAAILAASASCGDDVVRTEISIKENPALPCISPMVDGKPSMMNAYQVDVFVLGGEVSPQLGKTVCETCVGIGNERCALAERRCSCEVDRPTSVASMGLALAGIRLPGLQADARYCVRVVAVQLDASERADCTCPLPNGPNLSQPPAPNTPPPLPGESVRACAISSEPTPSGEASTTELLFVCPPEPGFSPPGTGGAVDYCFAALPL